MSLISRGWIIKKVVLRGPRDVLNNIIQAKRWSPSRGGEIIYCLQKSIQLGGRANEDQNRQFKVGARSEKGLFYVLYNYRGKKKLLNNYQDRSGDAFLADPEGSRQCPFCLSRNCIFPDCFDRKLPRVSLILTGRAKLLDLFATIQISGDIDLRVDKECIVGRSRICALLKMNKWTLRRWSLQVAFKCMEAIRPCCFWS